MPGNAMMAGGVLIAIAVAVTTLALTGIPIIVGLTSPTTAHPTTAQLDPIAHPRP